MDRRPHFREPVWRTPHQAFCRCPPAALLPWLTDDSSLTQRLMERCGSRFRVELIRQRRARPEPSEARALGLRGGAFALVREVYLCCGDERWVYARTVIPDTTAAGRYRRLRRMGERPIGAFLFAQPRLQRADLEIAQADAGGAAAGSWGRRSVFRVDGRPLLVTEYFLPAFTGTL
ncbi:MAG: chorismate lyase [Thiohalomonadaceae bacterium]